MVMQYLTKQKRKRTRNQRHPFIIMTFIVNRKLYKFGKIITIFSKSIKIYMKNQIIVSRLIVLRYEIEKYKPLKTILLK